MSNRSIEKTNQSNVYYWYKYPGTGSLRTVLNLKDSSKTKNRGLGLQLLVMNVLCAMNLWYLYDISTLVCQHDCPGLNTRTCIFNLVQRGYQTDHLQTPFDVIHIMYFFCRDGVLEDCPRLEDKKSWLWPQRSLALSLKILALNPTQ